MPYLQVNLELGSYLLLVAMVYRWKDCLIVCVNVFVIVKIVFNYNVQGMCFPYATCRVMNNNHERE